MTTAEILKHVQELPEAEQLSIAVTVVHQVGDAVQGRLTEEEHHQIESVLADRIDGPFIPIDDMDEFRESVFQRSKQLAYERREAEKE